MIAANGSTKLKDYLPNIDPQKYIDGFNTSLLSPANAKGISGFEFDISNGEDTNLDSEITDHYTENNSFVNDHIVNKPIKVTLKGFIGEVVYKKRTGLAGILSSLGTKLSTVNGYFGSYTPGFVQTLGDIVAQTAVAENEIQNKLEESQNMVGFLSSPFSAKVTKQAEAYQKLYSLWVNKTIVTVQTPWAYHSSMVIESISFTQTESSDDYSELSVRLKEFRVIDFAFTTFNNALFKQPNEVQSAPEVNNGPIKGKPENRTQLKIQSDNMGFTKPGDSLKP